MFKFSKLSLERLNGVDPKLVTILKIAILLTPIDFGIAEGVRDADTQKKYYDLGKSKLDGTNKISKHQEGKAVDIYAWVNGKASWDPIHLAVIFGVVHAIAKAQGINLRWGATFGSDNYHGWDTNHIELDE
jgi:hypothetical protein